MTEVEERFERMMAPKTAEDYGISMTYEELQSFEKGRQFADEYLVFHNRENL